MPTVSILLLCAFENASHADLLLALAFCAANCDSGEALRAFGAG
jgi:hypothetical protein